MLRSISINNFIHFRKPQRLEFEDGANYIIGGNSTGKTAIFELIRRCLSNDINTTFSSIPIPGGLSYSVCHFCIPKNADLQPHFSDIAACIFVDSKNDQEYHDYYKVLCTPNDDNSYDCYVKKCENGYFNQSPVEPVYRHVIKNCNFENKKLKNGEEDFDNHMGELFDSIKNKSKNSPNCHDMTVQLYDFLSSAYVGVLPMRCIGPLQWTRSSLNCHTKRETNYKTACLRAEIIRKLLNSTDTDQNLKQMYSQALVHPYTFEEDPDDKDMIVVRNSKTKGKSRPLLKTPEGIIEAEQLILLLSQTNIFTLTIEEPDRGMHPQMIEKMRNWIFKKVKDKSLLIITHNPSMLDHSVVDRTHICYNSQTDGIVSHDVIRFPRSEKGEHIYRRYGRVEEMKNILFSQRVLFVEGFTDKIILEAIFDVLCNYQDLNYVHHGKEAVKIDEHFKQFISSIQIVEMEGKDNGSKKIKFCNELKKKYFVVKDVDEVRISRIPFHIQFGDFDETFKHQNDFISNKDMISRFDSVCKEKQTFIWVVGAIEAVIDTVADEFDTDTKKRLDIPMIENREYKVWKKRLVSKSDKDIFNLAKTIICKSSEFTRFSEFLWRMMLGAPMNSLAEPSRSTNFQEHVPPRRSPRRKISPSKMDVLLPSSPGKYRKRRSPGHEIGHSEMDISGPSSPSKDSKRRSPRRLNSPKTMDTSD